MGKASKQPRAKGGTRAERCGDAPTAPACPAHSGWDIQLALSPGAPNRDDERVRAMLAGFLVRSLVADRAAREVGSPRSERGGC